MDGRGQLANPTLACVVTIPLWSEYPSRAAEQTEVKSSQVKSSQDAQPGARVGDDDDGGHRRSELAEGGGTRSGRTDQATPYVDLQVFEPANHDPNTGLSTGTDLLWQGPQFEWRLRT
jgi:hypothetical protein